MILECYQCSSCYFEDKRSSTTIAPETLSPAQSRIEFKDVVLAFLCVEMYDSREEVKEVVLEFERLLAMIGKRRIVVCPNVQL